MYNKKSILRIIAKKMHEKKRNIVMDFTPDSDPENWRTINHAHVHLNEAGEIDGGQVESLADRNGLPRNIRIKDQQVKDLLQKTKMI